MKSTILFLLTSILLFAHCKEDKETIETTVINEVETDISEMSTKDFREFKVLDSKLINNVSIWTSLGNELSDFTEAQYQNLKPLILEQTIHSLQRSIVEGKLSYETLTKFYLYRIRKYDRENKYSLNAVISINPDVIEEAKAKDRNKNYRHPIYGMPILLKDNINTKNMPTTAGAAVLYNNTTEDAFIVKQLKANGALILGKTNLSEWAYYFCGDCPSGYSAVGGQTLNPYGRKIIDAGGSSSGSAVAVAANFCVAAVGSETAGSILSPASQNSVVGLKPTIGLLSRTGIVPISSTLDTSGPITKNVIDNIILLDALFGYDKTDTKSINTRMTTGTYFKNAWGESSIKGYRFGAYKKLLKDSLYTNAISLLKSKGATVIEIEENDIELPAFLRLLNLDMKVDLPTYLSKYANASIGIKTVKDIINFNKRDSSKIMPYGQKLFEGIVKDKATVNELAKIKNTLKANGKQFFDDSMAKHNLDGVLSINNYHAAYAAVAEYPAITVPMGYTNNNEPKGLTFIAKTLKEKQLLEWALVFDSASLKRKAPTNYN